MKNRLVVNANVFIIPDDCVRYVASVAISCSSGGSIQETDCQHQQHNHLYFHRKRESHVLQQRMVQYLEPRLGVRVNYITYVTYVFVS